MQEHHAFLVYASDLALASIPEAYKVQSVDVTHYRCERLSIEQVRELIGLAMQAPVASPVRIFVIQTREIAPEAQHALLKLFEEPHQKVKFYVVLPRTATLLQTLRSRLLEMGMSDASLQKQEAFMEFVRAPYSERLALIAQKTKEKDHVWIDMILQGAEIHCAESPMRFAPLISAIVFARSHIGAPGASAKMLLEEVSLHL